MFRQDFTAPLCQAASGSNVQLASLLGCWRLEEFVVERPSGTCIHPFGTDAEGLLLYSPDGWVSAVLSKRDRGDAAVRTLESASKASAEVKVEAFDSYMSYAGRYRLNGSTVVHEIVVALAPGLVGTKMSREAHLEDSTLTLSYQVEGRLGISNYVLRWVRPSQRPHELL